MREYMSSEARPEPQPVDQYQKPLFLETKSEVLTWQDYEQDKNQGVLAMTGEVGPHTVVAERAERLILAMNTLAHRNMLFGLVYKGHDHDDNTGLIQRYADGLPIVLDHSEKKVSRLEHQALDMFWSAAGYEALRGAGLIGRNRVKTLFAADWRDFRHSYGHPKVHKDLVKLRRTQEKFLPMDHPLREENRLARYRNENEPNTIAA